MKKYLYDINDFYETWDSLIWAIKKHKTIENTTFNEDLTITPKIVCLLIWYGCTLEDILNIKTEDVSEKGIKGLDIVFDNRTISEFMAYKKLNGVNVQRGNKEKSTFRPFDDNTMFIRVYKRTESGTTLTKEHLTKIIPKNLTVEPDDDWLRKIFVNTPLYDNGVMSRIYFGSGKEKFVFKPKTRKNQWVLDAARENGKEVPQENSILRRNFFTNYQAFCEYATEYEAQHPVVEEPIQKSIKEEIIKEPESEIITTPVEDPKIEQSSSNNDKIEVCKLSIQAARSVIEILTQQLNAMEQMLEEIQNN